MRVAVCGMVEWLASSDSTAHTRSKIRVPMIPKIFQESGVNDSGGIYSLGSTRRNSNGLCIARSACVKLGMIMAV